MFRSIWIDIIARSE